MENILEYVRFILYLVGTASALLLAGRLLPGKYMLSRLFGITALFWALNCIMLAVLLLAMMSGVDTTAAWTRPIKFLNAVLLAAGPTMILIWFVRQSDDGSE